MNASCVIHEGRPRIVVQIALAALLGDSSANLLEEASAPAAC
ncbi:MAG: hypothetical protein ACE37N_11940 [Pseudohongiellaceae bacterium]